VLGSVVLAVLVPGIARAQQKTFYLDRLVVAGAPDDGIAIWRPYEAPRSRFFAQMGLGFTLNPLRIRTVAQEAGNSALRRYTKAPVSTQLIDYATVGAEVGGRATFLLTMPFALYQSGSDPAPVGVVGGGDTAMEEAIFLTKMTGKVTVIHRKDSLRASKVMQKRAMDNPKIAWAWNQEVVEVLGEKAGGVTAVRTKDTVTGELRELPMQGLFIAIGHDPNTGLFKGQVETDAVGYIKVQPGTTKTSVPGVFAAGDAADPTYRQAVTAAGTGCMAAIDAERFISSGGEHH